MQLFRPHTSFLRRQGLMVVPPVTVIHFEDRVVIVIRVESRAFELLRRTDFKVSQFRIKTRSVRVAARLYSFLRDHFPNYVILYHIVDIRNRSRTRQVILRIVHLFVSLRHVTVTWYLHLHHSSALSCLLMASNFGLYLYGFVFVRFTPYPQFHLIQRLRRYRDDHTPHQVTTSKDRRHTVRRGSHLLRFVRGNRPIVLQTGAVFPLYVYFFGHFSVPYQQVPARFSLYGRPPPCHFRVQQAIVPDDHRCSFRLVINGRLTRSFRMFQANVPTQRGEQIANEDDHHPRRLRPLVVVPFRGTPVNEHHHVLVFPARVRTFFQGRASHLVRFINIPSLRRFLFKFVTWHGFPCANVFWQRVVPGCEGAAVICDGLTSVLRPSRLRFRDDLTYDLTAIISSSHHSLVPASVRMFSMQRNFGHVRVGVRLRLMYAQVKQARFPVTIQVLARFPVVFRCGANVTRSLRG